MPAPVLRPGSDVNLLLLLIRADRERDVVPKDSVRALSPGYGLNKTENN